MVPLTFSCRSPLLHICCLQLSIQSFWERKTFKDVLLWWVFVHFMFVASAATELMRDDKWSVRCSLTSPLTFPAQCWCFWSSDKVESSIELTVDLECHSHEQKRKLKGTSWSIVSPQVEPRFCYGLGKFLINTQAFECQWLCATVPLITDKQETTPIFHAGV